MKLALCLALCLSPWLLQACTDRLPGHSVATYRVVMKLEQNTCGADAVNTFDGKDFSVELREDEHHGYWHRADTAPTQGTLDADRHFKFESSSIVARESADAGPDACTLVQDEVLSGMLRAALGVDAGSAGDAGAASGDVSNLVGEHILRISSYEGTDCSRALIAAGGPFEALPCTIRYTLSGIQRDPF